MRRRRNRRVGDVLIGADDWIGVVVADPSRLLVTDGEYYDIMWLDRGSCTYMGHWSLWDEDAELVGSVPARSLRRFG